MTSNDHARSHNASYFVVFGALIAFTTVSFIVNEFVRADTMTAENGMLVIVSVAVVKAGLVGLWFMHLIADGRKIFFLILPPVFLATVLILGPADMVLVSAQ